LETGLLGGGGRPRPSAKNEAENPVHVIMQPPLELSNQEAVPRRASIKGGLNS
jgi:hypothetical protein